MVLDAVWLLPFVAPVGGLIVHTAHGHSFRSRYKPHEYIYNGFLSATQSPIYEEMPVSDEVAHGTIAHEVG